MLLFIIFLYLQDLPLQASEIFTEKVEKNDQKEKPLIKKADRLINLLDVYIDFLNTENKLIEEMSGVISRAMNKTNLAKIKQYIKKSQDVEKKIVILEHELELYSVDSPFSAKRWVDALKNEKCDKKASELAGLAIKLKYSLKRSKMLAKKPFLNLTSNLETVEKFQKKFDAQSKVWERREK